MLIHALRAEHLQTKMTAAIAAAAVTTNTSVFSGDQPCQCEICVRRF
jgi:hypothetical protein